MWADMLLADITSEQITEFKRVKRAAGYAESTIRGYCSTLYTLCSDAIEAGHLTSNPAEVKSNRGRRSGTGRTKGTRGRERVTTDALGALLLSERMALLSGRDESFIAGITMYNAGPPVGEMVGLEREYCRPDEGRSRGVAALRARRRLVPAGAQGRLLPRHRHPEVRVRAAPAPDESPPKQADEDVRLPPAAHRPPVPGGGAQAAQRLVGGGWRRRSSLTPKDRSLTELGIDSDLAERFDGDFLRGGQEPAHRGGVHVFTGRDGAPHHRRGPTNRGSSARRPRACIRAPRTARARSRRSVRCRCSPNPGRGCRCAAVSAQALRDHLGSDRAGITPHGLARHSPQAGDDRGRRARGPPAPAASDMRWAASAPCTAR